MNLFTKGEFLPANNENLSIVENLKNEKLSDTMENTKSMQFYSKTYPIKEKDTQIANRNKKKFTWRNKM